MKNKTHINILIDSEKAFDKIQHPSMIKKKKNSPESRYRGKTYLNKIKAINDKTRANIIVVKGSRNKTRVPMLVRHFYSTWFWKP